MGSVMKAARDFEVGEIVMRPGGFPIPEKKTSTFQFCFVRSDDPRFFSMLWPTLLLVHTSSLGNVSPKKTLHRSAKTSTVRKLRRLKICVEAGRLEHRHHYC
jgi:hypothetical protein